MSGVSLGGGVGCTVGVGVCPPSLTGLSVDPRCVLVMLLAGRGIRGLFCHPVSREKRAGIPGNLAPVIG